MRSCVISAFVLAVTLAPAATFAQTHGQQPPAGPPPAAQQPPAGQPPATPAAPAAPAAPKLTFTTPGGLLLVQVKPDQTATFEEMFAKLKANLARSQTPELSAMANSWKIYKTAEGMQGNALYVVLVDPAVTGNRIQFPGRLEQDDDSGRTAFPGDTGNVQEIRGDDRRFEQAQHHSGRWRPVVG